MYPYNIIGLHTLIQTRKDILSGLKDFKEKYLFVTQHEQGTPKRKQKRNDDEDSNHR